MYRSSSRYLEMSMSADQGLPAGIDILPKMNNFSLTFFSHQLILPCGPILGFCFTYFGPATVNV